MFSGADIVVSPVLGVAGGCFRGPDVKSQAESREVAKAEAKAMPINCSKWEVVGFKVGHPPGRAIRASQFLHIVREKNEWNMNITQSTGHPFIRASPT
jgi:hypothetical protein